jgi:hypothetical protein
MRVLLGIASAVLATAYAVWTEVWRFAATTLLATTCAVTLLATIAFVWVPHDSFMAVVVPPPPGAQHVVVLDSSSSAARAMPQAKVVAAVPPLSPRALARSVAEGVWVTMHDALVFAWFVGVMVAAYRRTSGSQAPYDVAWSDVASAIRAALRARATA